MVPKDVLRDHLVTYRLYLFWIQWEECAIGVVDSNLINRIIVHKSLISTFQSLKVKVAKIQWDLSILDLLHIVCLIVSVK